MLKQLDVLIGLVTVLTLVSLFITVINQAVLNFFHVRGKNLLSGLEALFATIAPGEKNQARALAEVVLRHPLISDSIYGANSWGKKDRRGLASAIRFEELVKILTNLAQAQTNPTHWVGSIDLQYQGHSKSVAKSDQAAKAVPTQDSADSKREVVEVLGKAAKTVLDALQGGTAESAVANNPTLNALLQSVQESNPTLANNLREEAKTLVRSATLTVQSAENDARQWFDTMEDRTAQWLSTHAQICTCVVALILAFALQLDLFRIVRDLNTDDKARSALVASAGDVQAKADAFEKSASATSAAPETQQAALVKTAQEIRTQAEGIQTQFEKTSFQLIPAAYPCQAADWWGIGQGQNGLHLLGLICMFALLSLGTPFWFNVLKSLTNFRPVLSQEVAKDGEDAAKKSK